MKPQSNLKASANKQDVQENELEGKKQHSLAPHLTFTPLQTHTYISN